MVVHASGTEKAMPLPTAGKYPDGEKYQPSAPSLPPLPPYSTVVPCKTRRPRKCCMVSSIVCNLLLLAVVIILGIMMITYVKRSKCANEVHRATQRLNQKNYVYQIDGCKVKNIRKMRKFQQISDYILEDIDDDDDEEKKTFYDDDRVKSPRGGESPRKGRSGGLG
ncbi:uncharacterized protein LOC144429738 isoform X1 [Styela clava]